jgi:chorismate mutase / prephenate dehydratase
MREGLTPLRKQLDVIDDQLLDLLAARRAVVARVAAEKARHGWEVRDRAREAEIVGRLTERARALGLDGRFVAGLLRRVVADSVRRQREQLGASPDGSSEPLFTLSIGFQGIAGAYGEQAGRQWLAQFGLPGVCCGVASFEELVANLEQGVHDLAALPVANSTTGAIAPALAALEGRAVAIVGEEVVEVRHCLVGLEALPVAELRTVRSHPQALAQCRGFFARHPHLRCEEDFDTAGAARRLREEGHPRVAAIASARAGDLYGLVVLAEGIADSVENRTRFLLLARAGGGPQP